MKSYKIVAANNNRIKGNLAVEGERIEEKIKRITQNNEPISDGAPLIYTERSEGTAAAYNIKTDRWDIALDAMDAVSKTMRAKRSNIGEEAKKNMEKEKYQEDGGKPAPEDGTK